MRACFSSAKWSFVLILILAPLASLRAQQQPTFLVPLEMKNQSLRGAVAVAQHENDGMIGINGKGTEAGYKVETVTPGGPASSAGISSGDVILSVDGISLKSLNTTDTLKAIARKKEGETANLVFVRNGETKTASVVVVLRKNFLKNDPSWQQESKSPPGVSQLIFGGSAGVLAQLAESEQYPSDVFLNVYVASKDAAPFVADDTKFGSGSSLVQAHRSESPQATETLWNESSFQEVVS